MRGRTRIVVNCPVCERFAAFAAKTARRSTVVSPRRSGCWRSRRSPPASSKHRPQMPRREFLVAHPGEFAFRFVTAGHGDDFLEDTPSDLLDRFAAVEDGAGVDVHVFLHPAVERSV